MNVAHLKDCQCKKPSEFNRLHIVFEGKKRYFVETCMKCNGRVYEDKQNTLWLLILVLTVAFFFLIK